MPATPAAPPRPSTGASAKASPPKKRALKPSQSAKPIDESSETGSPRATSPNTFELIVVMTASTAMASPIIVRCAASFSSASRRLPNGVTGDDVEAAAAGLSGERRREGQDRPDRSDEDEDEAVLPGHVATEGAEPHRLAEEGDHLGGHATDERVDLTARLRRREDAGDRGTHHQRRARRAARRR